jgi:hypothetical protein
MSTITRRRSRRDDEDTPAEEETPRRRRRPSDEDESSEDRPSRSRRSRRDEDEDKSEERERPRRRRRGGDDEDSPRRRRRAGSRGFGSYEQKKAQTSDYADDFKPGADNPTLIKFAEEEPFDSYNQHWIESRDLPRDVKRNSYVCLDDEYFGDRDERDDCPLCEIGEPAKTYSLFNVIDLTNPRKPVVKVWTAPPGVTEKLKRAAKDKKTSPLNRDDLYFDVELVKSKNKSEWTVKPVKARDLQEDYDMDPLEPEEIEDLEKDLFTDRTAVTKVDSVEELEELADSLD